MAKKNTEKDIAKLYEAKHRYNLKGFQRQIDNIYREAAKEAASLSTLIGDFNPDVPFSFADYPITHKRIDKLLKGLGNGLDSVIVNGVRSEWTLANNKNNELSRMVFGNTIGSLSDAQYSRYFSTNHKALDAYVLRKRDGLNLSERVWRYADQFKQEIEMGIDIGLRDGLSANDMTISLKQYLQHPDKLFRRVRDEHGQLYLSKAAKVYHPGQGVYRSSYKNARRLAVTEGNIAFHTADYLRMQEMDFIVGQHVILSNNHTCLGVKGVFYDICDELSGRDENDPRGRYPKDFKFTGWHPHCRCGVIAILKTEDEIAEDTRKILAGEPLDGESKNKIEDTPTEFKEWLGQNEDRIAHAKNLPYFMVDNEKYCPEMKTTIRARAFADQAQRGNEVIIEALKPVKKTPLEIAAERHAERTPEQIDEIKKRLYERENEHRIIKLAANNMMKVAQDYGEVDYSKLEGYINALDLDKMQEETKLLGQQILDMRKKEQALADLIPDVHKWHHQFTMVELSQVYDAVGKKISLLDNLPLNKQQQKLEFEIKYLADPSKYKAGAIKYKTWEVAQTAYSKQLEAVVDKIEWAGIDDKLQIAKNYVTKSKAYSTLVGDLQAAISSSKKADAIEAIAKLEAKKDELEKAKIRAAKQRIGKYDTINLPNLTQKQINEMLKRFDSLSLVEADKEMRQLTTRVWSKLTEVERIMVTKYTQTYSYLNEPLRGITYYGSNKDYAHDLPILTRALAKCQLQENIVVRRGVRDYDIKELGCRLSNIKVGEVFTEKGFLSTAVERNSGFFNDINLVICVPKGAHGIYAEPFSHYTDNNKYSVVNKTKPIIWGGKTKEKFGKEMEWIGQRGSQFQVLKKSGKTIYLKMIGQLK